MSALYIEGYARLGRRYAGLTGTIGYRLLDQDGDVAVPFTTANVVETTIPGDYEVVIAGNRGLPLPSATWAGKVIWGTAVLDLAEEEIGPPPWTASFFAPPTTPTAAGSSSSVTRDGLAEVYCTDEDIAIRAESDYESICPDSQVMSQSRDGVFDAAQPWVLTSETEDFLAEGVHARQVIRLSQPSSAFRVSQYLAVDGVAQHALSLRRLGKPPGSGLPPGKGGVTAVWFTIQTFDPQIDNASFEANKWFNIDPAVSEQAPSKLYDPRDLEQFCVLHVLIRAYGIAAKSKDSSNDIKYNQFMNEFEDLKQRVQVRWGAQGESARASRSFGARITR